jgi:hypothetical protein
MAHQPKMRPSAAGANRGKKAARASLGFSTLLDADSKPHKKAAAPKPEQPKSAKTIEGRLEDKASRADSADYARMRSLGQMTDKELRKRLFGL